MSNALPRFHPPLIPIQIPMTVAKIVPSPTSRIVGHRREYTIIVRPAGRSAATCPRLPLSVCRTYVTYCVRQRLIEPELAPELGDVLLGELARSARAVPTGSPGSTRNRKKLKVSTNTSVMQRLQDLAEHVPPRAQPRPLLPVAGLGDAATPLRALGDGRGAPRRSRPPRRRDRHDPDPPRQLPDRRATCDRRRRPGARDQRVVVVARQQVAVRARRRHPSGEAVVAVGLRASRDRRAPSPGICVVRAALRLEHHCWRSARSNDVACSSYSASNSGSFQQPSLHEPHWSEVNTNS